MKKIVSLLLTLVMLVGVTSVLGSCGAPKDPGAQISVYLGDEIYDFDPTDYYVDSNAQQVMSLIFDHRADRRGSGLVRHRGCILVFSEIVRGLGR